MSRFQGSKVKRCSQKWANTLQICFRVFYSLFYQKLPFLWSCLFSMQGTIRKLPYHFFANFLPSNAPSFCPDKIIFVPDKMLFVPDKTFFVLDKKFCSKLKMYIFACEKDEKWLFRWTKNFRCQKVIFHTFHRQNCTF